jgi:hypothetical protein
MLRADAPEGGYAQLQAGRGAGGGGGSLSSLSKSSSSGKRGKRGVPQQVTTTTVSVWTNSGHPENSTSPTTPMVGVSPPATDVASPMDDPPPPLIQVTQRMLPLKLELPPRLMP